MTARLAALAFLFAHLSLFSVGGANSVIPAMHRELVLKHAWLDGQLFASLVAIAQAAPGPNAMVVGLSGWHVAGALGALVATVAFCGPPAMLTIAIGRMWGRIRASKVGPSIIEGAAPLTVGLIFASAWSLMRAQGFHAETMTITLFAAMAAVLRSQNAGWLLALGAGAAVALG